MFYFTADTHFGHANIIKHCDRPFPSVEEMNEFIINNWNDRATQRDTIFILGDMFFRCENVEEILSRLKGKKRLILGNHDEWAKHVDCNKYFLSVDKYLESTDGQHSLTLCHYPMLAWKHAPRAYMVHGHIHNDCSADYWPFLQKNDHILNAGVDINGFGLVNFHEMVENNKYHKETSGKGWLRYF